MKSEILAALRERAEFVSGQELCSHFGVSRTAVWKSINQLKEEGHQIEAVSNKGYRLIHVADTVSEAVVGSLLKTKWAGRNIKYLEQVDSTNTYIKKMAEKGAPHGTLVIADEQLQGKGRRGKIWKVPGRTSVMISLLLRPDFAPNKASMLTLLMGLAGASACRKEYGLDVQIKWPNDLVVNKKKLCGILTEMSAEMDSIHYLVTGMGINSNISLFPEELEDIATSLEIELGHSISRAALIASCLEAFEGCYERFLETEDLSLLIEDYNQLLAGKDAAVKVLDPKGSFTGISRGINSQGELLVEQENGEVICVYAGEVSVRGLYGYV